MVPESGIEIKDGGAPLPIYYVPVDLDTLYRWEKASENRSHRGCSLNGRANRSHEFYVLVKWRSTYISRSKPVQVRFNSMDHVFPHEELHFWILPETPGSWGRWQPDLTRPGRSAMAGDKSP
jgi:hypothetical protein